MSSNHNIRLSGAQILRDNTLVSGGVPVIGGRLCDPGSTHICHHIDLTGYTVLPCIIDLHGDAFERPLSPCTSAPFPSEIGLHSFDRDAAANGVTAA